VEGKIAIILFAALAAKPVADANDEHGTTGALEGDTFDVVDGHLDKSHPISSNQVEPYGSLAGLAINTAPRRHTRE
jgi:hypothetical protein